MKLSSTADEFQAKVGERLENDVCFILTSAFLIFTMQSGYALLESGIVSRKNEVNILLKNAVNIICGSVAFWTYGFAFSSWHTAQDTLVHESTTEVLKNKTATGKTITTTTKRPLIRPNNANEESALILFLRTNVFSWDRIFANVPITVGSGRTNAVVLHEIDTTYVEMAFQLAYATTCTAIISGAMAERCRFRSYFLFSLTSTVLFCLPARWIMFEGWLTKRGVIDFGGSGFVHLVGGCAGLVAAILLGPRLGRFELMENNARPGGKVPMGNATNSLHGLILLWWGWLGYSAGSSFGITNEKWKYSARASVVTTLASMAGGACGMVWSAVTRDGVQDIKILLDSLISALVAISGGAPIIRPVYAIATGVIGTLLTLSAIPLIERFKVDDPTNAFAVHGVAGAWGLLAISMFADEESIIHYYKDYRHAEHWGKEGANLSSLRKSLIYSQLLALVILVAWSVLVSLLLLLPIHFTIGLRMPQQMEILGNDYTEHGLEHEGNRHLLRVIRQKVSHVSSGISELQASTMAMAYFSGSPTGSVRKRSLTPGNSPWTDSRLYRYANRSNQSRMSRPSPFHIHFNTPSLPPPSTAGSVRFYLPTTVTKQMSKYPQQAPQYHQQHFQYPQQQQEQEQQQHFQYRQEESSPQETRSEFQKQQSFQRQSPKFEQHHQQIQPKQAWFDHEKHQQQQRFQHEQQLEWPQHLQQQARSQFQKQQTHLQQDRSEERQQNQRKSGHNEPEWHEQRSQYLKQQRLEHKELEQSHQQHELFRHKRSQRSPYPLKSILSLSRTNNASYRNGEQRNDHQVIWNIENDTNQLQRYVRRAQQMNQSHTHVPSIDHH